MGTKGTKWTMEEQLTTYSSISPVSDTGTENNKHSSSYEDQVKF
jgi:hypothetical protein